MKRDMKQWVADTIDAPVKKPMPVLSFPAVQLMGITVRDLISSSEHQAQGMLRPGGGGLKVEAVLPLGALGQSADEQEPLPELLDHRAAGHDLRSASQ